MKQKIDFRYALLAGKEDERGGGRKREDSIENEEGEGKRPTTACRWGEEEDEQE